MQRDTEVVQVGKIVIILLYLNPLTFKEFGPFYANEQLFWFVNF